MDNAGYDDYITINGVELRLDLFDADTMEKYEKAYDTMSERVNKELAAEGLTHSEEIRIQCRAISDMFEGIFGVGICENLFEKGPYNLAEHMSALVDLTNASTASRERMDGIIAKGPAAARSAYGNGASRKKSAAPDDYTGNERKEEHAAAKGVEGEDTAAGDEKNPANEVLEAYLSSHGLTMDDFNLLLTIAEKA